MQIRILKSGPYMNRRNGAVLMQRGDILETKDWYAQSLIESGFAEPANRPGPGPDPEITAPDDPVDSGAWAQAGDRTEEPGPDAETEPKPEDTQALPAVAELPGMTNAVFAELLTRGLTQTDAFIEAMQAGKLKDLHVSRVVFNNWKKALGLKG